MGEEFTITCTAFPYNMASWCEEKSSFVVQELAEIADLLNNHGLDTEETKEKIKDILTLALHDATKLLSFSCGAEWALEDRERIIKQGSIAFRQISQEYGIDTGAFFRIDRARQIIEECKGLLAEKRAPNRTYLHELFGRPIPEYVQFDKIRDELEKVTMGECEWPEFVCFANECLDDLSECLVAEETELKKMLRNPFSEYASVPSSDDKQ